jgi:prolyl-tRNA editing enzyme YbaK/EbsC (Cys-tRNA(Pro) deacylase)
MDKYVQRVHKILVSHHFDGEIIIRDQTTRTAQEAAKVSGVEVGQIVKSLIFKDAETNLPILILVSGKNQVDTYMFQETQKVSLTKADANFVYDCTGFHIGGVSPIGHTQNIQTYIDKDLFDYDEIWASAGTAFSVFQTNPTFLQKISTATRISVN